MLKIEHTVIKRMFALCIITVCILVSTLTAKAQTESSNNETEKPVARIIVNVPAFKLLFYRGDQLVKTYPITIGSRDYSSPYGVSRKAVEIVWNPRWTPPSSDWARHERPAAPGAANNPLGRLKIRMADFPFLIHGGGDRSLNQAVSHGCVRLRNSDVLELANMLVEICQLNITEKQIKSLIARRTREHGVKITAPVEVEFRYDTITVEDGLIHIYPDIYREGTNTWEHLAYALYQSGIDHRSLSESERVKLEEALKQAGKKTLKLPLPTYSSKK